MLYGKRADALINQMRLDRRAAGRIDDERDRTRVPGLERAIKYAGGRGERQARLEWRGETDDAGKPHDRHDRDVAAKARGQQRIEPRKASFKYGWLGHGAN